MSWVEKAERPREETHLLLLRSSDADADTTEMGAGAGAMSAVWAPIQRELKTDNVKASQSIHEEKETAARRARRADAFRSIDFIIHFLLGILYTSRESRSKAKPQQGGRKEWKPETQLVLA